MNYQLNSFRKKTSKSFFIQRGLVQQVFWKDELCQLRFNRLSILDLSEDRNQPLLSPSGNFAMIFNDEVFNYKEIQQKYSNQDVDLRSSSDSEIILNFIQKNIFQTHRIIC